MARSRKSWINRQQKDPYARAARSSHYRSRAAFKLQEIDERDQLFKKARTIIDVGASPGSWSQYAVSKTGPQGHIVAVDILPIEPIENVHIIEGDICEDAILEACVAALEGKPVDLVMSDIAPNLSGVRTSDQARSIYLAELVLDFAGSVLNAGGDLVIKLFQGEGTDTYMADLRLKFQKVMVRKPKASRSESREFYVLARGYKL